MKNSQFFSAFLFTACVGVYGSEWHELPCKSKDLSEVKLLANSTTVQLWNGKRKLVEEKLCSSKQNLVRVLLDGANHGIYTINVEEGNKYEWGFVERVIPLKGSSGRVFGQTSHFIIVGVTCKILETICNVTEDLANRFGASGNVEVQLPFAKKSTVINFEMKPGSGK
jgi:hypothetical protein